MKVRCSWSIDGASTSSVRLPLQVVMLPDRQRQALGGQSAHASWAGGTQRLSEASAVSAAGAHLYATGSLPTLRRYWRSRSPLLRFSSLTPPSVAYSCTCKGEVPCLGTAIADQGLPKWLTSRPDAQLAQPRRATASNCKHGCRVLKCSLHCRGTAVLQGPSCRAPSRV